MEYILVLMDAFFKLPAGLFLSILVSFPFTLLGIYFIAEKIWKKLRKK